MRIVFNLSPLSDRLFLPTAYVVEEDANEGLTHLLKRATPDVLTSYGLAPTPEIEALLLSVEQLSLARLEKKFKPSKTRATVPLKTLLAQDETRSTIEAFLHRELSRLLAEAIKHQIPITLQAERSALVQKALLHPIAEPLMPHLFFRKTSQGIEYRLTLGTETEQWPIREQGLIPLTNTEPAWAVARQQLFRVVGINGNMLRPFLQKDAVEIPATQVKDYFQKFILKAAARAHIEAEGFEVQSISAIQSASLELVENLFQSDIWKFRLAFDYEGVRVGYAERRERITSLLHLSDARDEPAVRVVQRDRAQEHAWVKRLLQLGFAEENGYFYLPALQGLSETLNWLVQHRPMLEQAGFQIEAPIVSGYCLALLPHELTITSEASGDWFDVYGEIQVGQHRVPFRDLIPYLRSGNPYFPLSEALYFRIPDEWFARYGTLAQHLRTEGNRARLPKALYALLPQHPPGAPAQEADFQAINPETVRYVAPSELKASLRPYQLYGVKWLIAHEQQGFGACLADDMGLGKTLQTIAVLLHLKQQGKTTETTNARQTLPTAGATRQMSLFEAYQSEMRPLRALVILPTSLVFNWKCELERFAPSLFVYVHTGPKRLRDWRAIAGHDVVLTTYHTARQDLKLLSQMTWRVIVLDESQQIKNRESEVSKVVRSLQGHFKISLSGTPIENSLADLWTQMEFINPEALGSFREFRERFLLPIEKRNDETAKQRLFEIVRPFFLRRTKEEVAPDLPALTEQVFYSEMTPEQFQAYERIKSAMRNEILQLFDNPQTRARALNELMRLRQMANHPALVEPDTDLPSGKFEDVLSHWENARRAGHKVLFFSSFERHLRLFRQHFEARNHPFAWLTGDTAERERALEIERFQKKPEVQAFFMTLKAGGVGLNLTTADYVFLLDPWWNPAVEQQAIARAHRIGQSRPVSVLRFITRRSIEEKMLLLQERKRQLGKQFFGLSEALPELSRKDVEMLLE